MPFGNFDEVIYWKALNGIPEILHKGREYECNLWHQISRKNCGLNANVEPANNKFIAQLILSYAEMYF